MANADHLHHLENLSVKDWNKWRKDNPNTIPDLIGADLTNISLRKRDLSKSKLCGATLPNDLAETDFSDANLSNAKLIRADCNTTKFDRATLSGTDFFESEMTINTSFMEAKGLYKTLNLPSTSFTCWSQERCSLF